MAFWENHLLVMTWDCPVYNNRIVHLNSTGLRTCRNIHPLNIPLV